MEGDTNIGKIYTTAMYMKEVMPVYHEMIQGVVVGCTPVPTLAHGGDVDLSNPDMSSKKKESRLKQLVEVA